ncbi:hypothetical protein B0H13DRAFT_2329495 [Mycena leptocephala]|nr:hypothetical protein B0H13DRAFT_2329495 [Mycena leptocephala]
MNLISPPTNEIPAMNWHFVSFTREQIYAEDTVGSKTVQAVLIPDGGVISKWVWARVPLHHGVQRAHSVDDLDTDIWFDSGCGIGQASSDLTDRSFQIDRYPLDEPKDLAYSYTIVIAPQHTSGSNVHPVNHLLNELVPELATPWRGNILIFRHGKANKFLINVEEKNLDAIEMMLAT